MTVTSLMLFKLLEIRKKVDDYGLRKMEQHLVDSVITSKDSG